jgi:DNA-binding NarL/FixJ family response regulator
VPASGSISPESPPGRRISILLVDDHQSSRTPLALLLNHQPDLLVVAEAGSASEARAIVSSGVEFDVAVVDLDLGDSNGIEVIRLLRTERPGAAILVLTGLRDDRARGEALYEGAAAAMLKSVSTDELIEGIRALGSGYELTTNPGEAIELLRAWIDELKSEWRFEQAAATLTSREHEVLAALMDGLTDEEIAERFRTSIATVRTQVRSVVAKLGVDSRLKAVVLAYRAGHLQTPTLPPAGSRGRR